MLNHMQFNIHSNVTLLTKLYLEYTQGNVYYGYSGWVGKRVA